MIFVHAADLHLGSPLGGLDAREDLPVDMIRQAPMRAFERIAALCEERGAGLLVLAGDLFDGDADLPTMYRAAEVIQRITRAGTQVVSIRGNHDAASRMSARMPAIDGFHELPTDAPGTIVFSELGVAVHGRGFDQQHVAENIVTAYPDPVPDVLNVGVLHTSLTGAAAGHKAYAPCSVADLTARGYDYWALGHVHQRAVHHEFPWVVFAGNPQGRDVGEVGARSVTVVEYDGARISGTPEAVPVDGVRWHVERVELLADETADDVVERVRARFADIVASAPELRHVVRLVVHGRGAAHAQIAGRAEWLTEVHGAAMGVAADRLWIERIVVDTSPALPPTSELLEREDFIGDAARILLDGDGAVEELLQHADPFAQLDRKLAQLPAGALPEAGLEAAERELDHAREAVLGSLLAQHADEVRA